MLNNNLHKKRHKDIDARWTKKNNENFYGYVYRFSQGKWYKRVNQFFQLSKAENHFIILNHVSGGNNLLL